MYDRRMKNVETFKDTEYMYQTNEKLKAAVTKSINNQKLILAEDVLEIELLPESRIAL